MDSSDQFRPAEALMFGCLNPIHRPPPISGPRGPCRRYFAHYDQGLARSMLGQGPQERPKDTIQRPLAIRILGAVGLFAILLEKT